MSGPFMTFSEFEHDERPRALEAAWHAVKFDRPCSCRGVIWCDHELVLNAKPSRRDAYDERMRRRARGRSHQRRSRTRRHGGRMARKRRT